MRPEYFDRILHTHGQRGMKTMFYKLLHECKSELYAAIGDEKNSFPVMYMLAGEIEQSGLEDYLPEHVVYAYWITCCKLDDAARREKYAARLSKGDNGQPDPNYKAIKWMIATGVDWDGPSPGRDSFDAAIDLAAAYLAIYCPDIELMKKVAELIFRRNRRRLLVHDLAWGFFQTSDPSAMSAIAAYIISENNDDSRLACELLGIEPAKSRAEKHEAHRQVMCWLTENRPYVYLTGESFNATNLPHHLAFDEGAKFIGKEIDPRTRETLLPLTDDEREALAVFYTERGGSMEI